MRESDYRASRLCRLLGNPVVFALVSALADGSRLSPGALAEQVGRSGPLVSQHLGRLRLADVVRYDSAGRSAHYWLKHPAETRRVLAALNAFVIAAGPANR